MLVPSDVAGQNVRSLHRVRSFATSVSPGGARVNRPPPVACPSRGERGERGWGVSLLQVPSLLREGRAARLHQMSFKRVLSLRAIGGGGGGTTDFYQPPAFYLSDPFPLSQERLPSTAFGAPRPSQRPGRVFPGASRSWSVRPFGAASRARRMLKEPGQCLLSAFRTGAACRSEGDVERSPALHASPPFPFA